MWNEKNNNKLCKDSPEGFGGSNDTGFSGSRSAGGKINHDLSSNGGV